MSIQKEFEDAVNSQQFKVNKVDLTKDMYATDSYKDDVTQLVYCYFLAGYNAGMNYEKH